MLLELPGDTLVVLDHEERLSEKTSACFEHVFE
jgi:hypothetical protein